VTTYFLILLGTHLQPKLFVEGARDQTALEQDDYPDLVALLDLVVEVLLPVLELAPLQRLDVEVRPLDLQNGQNESSRFRRRLVDSRNYTSVGPCEVLITIGIASRTPQNNRQRIIIFIYVATTRTRQTVLTPSSKFQRAVTAATVFLCIFLLIETILSLMALVSSSELITLLESSSPGGTVRVVRFGLVGAVVFQHVPDLLAQRQELVDLHHFVGRIGRDVLLEAAQKRHRQLEFRVRRRHRLTFQSAWCSLGSAW
jgi:hypothetical protein